MIPVPPARSCSDGTTSTTSRRSLRAPTIAQATATHPAGAHPTGR